MPVIAALVYPEGLASSITLPAEIVHASNQMVAAQNRSLALTKFLTVSTTGSPQVEFSTGLTMACSGDVEDLSRCDVLLLPAIWRHPRKALRHVEPLFEVLHSAYQSQTILCSVGTASSLLAEAGLLDGKVATTHWMDFHRFAARYPQVELKRRHLITQNDRIFCVGSVNSIADFMVYQLGEWYGTNIARAVEAQFSPEARQSFETAAFLQQAPGNHHDAIVRELQDYLQANLAKPHKLEQLARRAEVAPRTLSRRFKHATGESPLEHLQKLRVKEAQSMLQHTDLSLAEIGWRCGFRSASRFSTAFRRISGLAPRDYRNAVRGKRFGAVKH
ncbi:MAG: helix-turn-helix domain-containing protein [Pseudomonadota bacterium]